MAHVDLSNAACSDGLVKIDLDEPMVTVAVIHFSHNNHVDEVVFATANESSDSIREVADRIRPDFLNLHGFRNSDCATVILDVWGDVIGDVSPNGQNIRWWR